jgi:hypothetical protein
VLKRDRDPSLDVFDRGCFVLRRDDEAAGYVATSLGTFWSPSRPLTIQQSVWLMVVWTGAEEEEPSFEDYPPWTVVSEIKSGYVTWDDGPRRGTYTATRLSDPESVAKWAELGITPDDF